MVERFRKKDFDYLVKEVERVNERADLSTAIKRLLQKSDENIITEQPKSIFEVNFPCALVE